MMLTPMEAWLGGGLIGLLTAVTSAMATGYFGHRHKVDEETFKAAGLAFTQSLDDKVDEKTCRILNNHLSQNMTDIKTGIHELQKGQEETLARISRLEAQFHGP